MFNTSKEAIEWIESVKKFGDKLDLSRMEIACEYLNHPEKNLNVIHIAGTNGKGSTVSYLKHILLEHNYNVGTFTSPYIVRFNERITYNHNDISDDELLYYINKIYTLHTNFFEKHNEVITFFELVTLISFLYFNDHPCDYVLYEVGLGGLLDATNVVQPMITAITSISFDHMGVLGDSLESIAYNKLGIVKQGIPLVTAIDQQSLFPLFQSHCDSLNSELIILDKDSISDISYSPRTSFTLHNETYETNMLGTHQVYNASLALTLLHKLEMMNKVSLQTNLVKQGLLKTHWPGRLETFGNVVLDGAHNIGGATALKNSILKLFKGKRIKVLFATMADKEYRKVLEILHPVIDEITCTEFDYPRCETSDNLYNKVNDLFIGKRITQSSNALKSLHELQTTLQDNEILLVTGSLYFISYIRKDL